MNRAGIDEWTLVFAHEGAFAALYAAQETLAKAGFSLGSWQRGAPCAAMYGDYDVSKWRNLREFERKTTHGILSGDGRHGPLTFKLSESAPVEARAAVSALRTMAAVHAERVAT